MAVQKEEGYKIVLEDLTSSNFSITKEATVWAEVDGSEMDFVILYEYVRKGSQHSSDMVTLDARQFELIAEALGYYKED